MQFRVRALDAQQQLQVLSIEALDEQGVRRLAAERNLVPVSVVRTGRRTSRTNRFSLLLFAQELHALTVAGLSVIETLEALSEREPSPERRSILDGLSTQLRQGVRLSAALSQQPASFTPLFVGMVQAAEGTSDLPRALGRYVEYESRRLAVRHKVASATIYPVVLLCVGGAVCLLLLGYVVPRFSAVYEASRAHLPWASRLLLAWGAFAGHHAPELAASVGLLGIAVFLWARGLLKRGGTQRLLYWLPAARARLSEFELSRLYLTLGMLLEGGIPVFHALSLAGAVLSPMRRADLEVVRHRIHQGDAFSDALLDAGLSTPISHRLIRVGEQSGQLGPMLTRAALFYEGETARWIERFTKTFEPTLMAAIGLVVGLIVLLLYMPIFELAGSLQ